MEKKIIEYNKMHVIHKTIPQNQIDLTRNFDSTFRRLSQTEVSEEDIMDHQNGFAPIWADHKYAQDNLKYRHYYDNQLLRRKLRPTTSLMTYTCQTCYDTRW